VRGNSGRITQGFGEREIFPALTEIGWRDHHAGSGINHAGKSQPDTRDAVTGIMCGLSGTRDGSGEIGNNFISSTKRFGLEFLDMLGLPRVGQPAKREGCAAKIKADGNESGCAGNGFTSRRKPVQNLPTDLRFVATSSIKVRTTGCLDLST
jgi:hypothetical protein